MTVYDEPATEGEAGARARLAGLDPREAAWLASAVAAVITLAAAVVLGPVLGAVLFPAPAGTTWASLSYAVLPEPTEQARFLIALSGPIVLALLTVRFARRAPEWLGGRVFSPAAVSAVVEIAALVVVVACVVAQRLQAPQNYTHETTPVVYFTLPTLVAALAIGAALAFGASSAGVRGSFARWTAESRGRQLAAGLLALAAIGLALLPAINTDGSIELAYEAVSYHLGFVYDEAMAVVDGRSPLGDFAAQYASLWPYALAGGMAVAGTSLAAFTGLTAALTGVMLLALYDLLRRLTRTSLGALLLFLPLLATFGFRLHGPEDNRFSLVNYFGVTPLRYAGPFLLAWLLVRHLQGARPRRVWPLFLLGGLVALNNTDMGIAAAGAVVAALVWTHRRGDPGVRRQVVEAVAGIAGALALVIALLLVRTGAPPDFSLLFRYAQVFAVEGFAMLPIKPLFGVAIVIYLTHVAGIAVATVRALRGAPDRALTGMLAWSGVFGLGAGVYYVGHSLSEVLIYTFPPWALTVTLLTLATLRELAATARRPRPGELACLAGFGVLVCSLAQLPLPGPQLERIGSHVGGGFAHPVGEATVAASTRPGEAVLIIAPLGHRIAVNLGLDDVERFTGGKSIVDLSQLEESLEALEAAGGSKVFVRDSEVYPGLADALETTFEPASVSSENVTLYVARAP